MKKRYFVCPKGFLLAMGAILAAGCGDGDPSPADGTTDADTDGDTDADTDTDTDTDTDSDTDTADGLVCAYNGEEPHTCECADGADNDSDGFVDQDDLHCYGPWDDDESSWATGIPGDNQGSQGDIECPFDGNSGTGNDDVCCNPEEAWMNVTPNGCDHVACCEIDVNGNLSGEHVYIGGGCEFAPECGTEGLLGCSCTTDGDCGEGQFCVPDDDSGAGFCSTCQPCEPDPECENPCECFEICFGGFEQPMSECGEPDTDTTDDQCPEGVQPCAVSSDCPDGFFCVTGCCIMNPE